MTLGCSSCAKAAARRRAGKVLKYVWQSEDGNETVEYDTAYAARAKRLRSGGTYKAVDVPK